jgi:Xaa-Pro aminopeptidase
MNPAPLFSLDEYQARLAGTRERMYREGIEVLLVTDPANMNYLSGYDGWSFYVHQGLLVFPDESIFRASLIITADPGEDLLYFPLLFKKHDIVFSQNQAHVIPGFLSKQGQAAGDASE